MGEVTPCDVDATAVVAAGCHRLIADTEAVDGLVVLGVGAGIGDVNSAGPIAPHDDVAANVDNGGRDVGNGQGCVGGTADDVALGERIQGQRGG